MVISVRRGAENLGGPAGGPVLWGERTWGRGGASLSQLRALRGFTADGPRGGAGSRGNHKRFSFLPLLLEQPLAPVLSPRGCWGAGGGGRKQLTPRAEVLAFCPAPDLQTTTAWRTGPSALAFLTDPAHNAHSAAGPLPADLSRLSVRGIRTPAMVQVCSHPAWP